MWDEIVNLAISNGLFAVMFLGLLIFSLRDGNAREKRYQQTIEKLSVSLQDLDKVRDSVGTIVDDIEVISNDVKEIKSNVEIVKSTVSKNVAKRGKKIENTGKI